jgi:hypothetical protein
VPDTKLIRRELGRLICGDGGWGGKGKERRQNPTASMPSLYPVSHESSAGMVQPFRAPGRFGLRLSMSRSLDIPQVHIRGLRTGFYSV